jgi:hypothetical protein
VSGIVIGVLAFAFFGGISVLVVWRMHRDGRLS